MGWRRPCALRRVEEGGRGGFVAVAVVAVVMVVVVVGDGRRAQLGTCACV